MTQNKEQKFPATGMPDQDWWQALWPNPKQLLKDAGIIPNMRVLDLCCGDGHFTLPICEILKEGHCIALDLDEDLLKKAAALCGNHSNFEALNCDAMNLSEKIQEPVDFVFIANTFHGIPDKETFVASVFQILKPGGEFAIVNWHQKPREETVVLGVPRGPKTEMRMTPESVIELLKPVGFRLRMIQDIGSYHYTITFKKP